MLTFLPRTTKRSLACVPSGVEKERWVSVFTESDAEIVLHRETSIPSPVEVHYLVDNVVFAVAHYAAEGCEILVAPFDITIGKCAVIRDPFGTRLCILDTTKGLRPPNLAEPQGLM